MRSSDSGKGRTKLIFALLVIGGMIYAGVQTVPVYVRAYEFQDDLRDFVYQVMAGRRPTAEGVRLGVISKANDLGLPVKAEDVTVVISMSKVTINVDYHVPVNLGVYTLNLHFTPSAENTSLY